MAEAEKTIRVVAKKLGFTETEREGVLSLFIAGGQLIAAGVANAVTSSSQTVADAAHADSLDDLALSALAKQLSDTPWFRPRWFASCAGCGAWPRRGLRFPSRRS